MSRVEFVNVEKKFSETVGVHRLNFAIEEGEFFTLLGPSGCGKTTTLRMVAGFLAPTAGQIFFDGQDITPVPPHLRNTAMVFQNYALFPHMTVFENVAFGLEVRKLPKSEIKERVQEALRQVYLSGFEDRRMSQLSGGQQQRVALARALVVRPRILLLDEPLSNLDARLRVEMREEISRLQKELGITTIYVTHDQEEALAMSDRIAVFHKGVCQQIGTPEEIYHQPANSFVASFVGESNLLPVEIGEISNGLLQVKVLDFLITSSHIPDLSQNTEGWVMSIRPEAIRLMSNPGPNSLPGTIERVQFTGSLLQCSVRVQNQLTLQLLMLNQTYLYRTIKPGDQVWLYFPKDQIRLLPKEGE